MGCVGDPDRRQLARMMQFGQHQRIAAIGLHPVACLFRNQRRGHHDQIYGGARAWTLAYRRWLTTVRFAHPAQQIVLQDYIHAVQDAEARLDRLMRQIEELLPSWPMAPVVAALQAMRGVALVVAVTVVAEVGDFRRFANARQLMAYL